MRRWLKPDNDNLITNGGKNNLSCRRLVFDQRCF